jgi:LysM repeat protein
MKRRTRLILIGCAALCGTFSFAAPAVAQRTEPVGQTVHQVAKPASDPPPRVVHAPVERVTVRPGDTLTAIGARTNRTWEQLASYNHIPNPNLILVDQVFTIPPAGYVPPSPVALPVAPVRSTQVVAQYSAPVVTQAAPSYAPGSFQACVAFRESTDGAGSSDIYGIEPYIWTDVLGRSGSPYSASRATQDDAFNQLYRMQGSRPWAPYDGC